MSVCRGGVAKAPPVNRSYVTVWKKGVVGTLGEDGGWRGYSMCDGGWGLDCPEALEAAAA